MNRIFISILSVLCCITANAQNVIHEGPLHSFDSPREGWLLPGDTIYNDTAKIVYSGEAHKVELVENKENKSNDVVAPTMLSPYLNDYGWGLHRGLNVSVDLSAFATIGHNLPHNGGFTQRLNATYLAPLTKDNKLWLAAGGYIQNINWGSDSYKDGALYAALGYKFNDHWEAWVYGQKSVTNNYSNYSNTYNRYMYGPYMYGMGYGTMGSSMGMPGADVIGAAVKYNFSPSFSIQLNVESAWYNNNKGFNYFDQYNYPVPQQR